MYAFHERFKETNVKGKILSSESGPAFQRTGPKEVTVRAYDSVFSRHTRSLYRLIPCKTRL